MNKIIFGICGLGIGFLIGLLFAIFNQGSIGEISAERDRLLKENMALVTKLEESKITNSSSQENESPSVYFEYFGPHEKTSYGSETDTWLKTQKDGTDEQAMAALIGVNKGVNDIWIYKSEKVIFPELEIAVALSKFWEIKPPHDSSVIEERRAKNRFVFADKNERLRLLQNDKEVREAIMGEHTKEYEAAIIEYIKKLQSETNDKNMRQTQKTMINDID